MRPSKLPEKARTLAAIAWVVTIALLLPTFALAQPASDEPQEPPAQEQGTRQDAAAQLRAAEEALSAALASGQAPHPDQPAWRDAYEAAESAIDAARSSGTEDDLRAALRLSARGYALMQWHARAFARYDEFIASGGDIVGSHAVPGDPSDLQLFVDASNQLAYARYQAGDHAGATGYYLTVLELAPDDPEALRWLARIAFERGDVEGARVAVGLWERLLAVEPGDDSASYYLERSRQRVAAGVAASDSFYAGLAAYEQGDKEGALNLFQAALTANPEFTDAEVWAGRIALELGLPDLASQHWLRVTEARPEDAGAAHFLRVAQAQSEHGTVAGTRYFEGLAAYEAGDLESATAAFVAATQAAPDFVEAWVWAARSLQESGSATESVPYWERVLELDPADERAAWFLRRARLATERGDVAGPAYFDAVAAYEAGEADRARALLEEALAAQPGFVEAWGYLGRIAFQQGRYLDAAEAYGRAAELAPDVDEYAFFAGEARRLAGLEEPAGSEPADGDSGDEPLGDDEPADEGSGDQGSGDEGSGDDEPAAPDDDQTTQPLPPG